MEVWQAKLIGCAWGLRLERTEPLEVADTIEEFIPQLESMTKRIGQLESQNQHLTGELYEANLRVLKLEDEIAEWKEASSLEVGGCPEGVTPKMAADAWWEAEQNAAALVDAIDPERKSFDADGTPNLTVLLRMVAELRA